MGWLTITLGLYSAVMTYLNYRLQKANARFTQRRPEVTLTPTFTVVGHERILSVVVVSTGADIHDFSLVLRVTKNGQTDFLPLKVHGDIPQPFKTHQSRRFELVNDEPHKESGVADIPLQNMQLVAFSGPTEIRSMDVSEHLQKMIHADSTLPGKPLPPPSQASGWSPQSYKGKW